MPEKWRRHFKVYRAKISIYLDTPDFGNPLMVDASEMMEFLPAGTDQASFIEKTGPVRPGAEALWIEADVPKGEVVIDGNIRGPARAGGEARDGTARRHLARGHFKTFTEDGSLLGKHVGTYWWGWQVRGQEGSGSIEKTYALKTSRL